MPELGNTNFEPVPFGGEGGGDPDKEKKLKALAREERRKAMLKWFLDNGWTLNGGPVENGKCAKRVSADIFIEVKLQPKVQNGVQGMLVYFKYHWEVMQSIECKESPEPYDSSDLVPILIGKDVFTDDDGTKTITMAFDWTMRFVCGECKVDDGMTIWSGRGFQTLLSTFIPILPPSISYETIGSVFRLADASGVWIPDSGQPVEEIFRGDLPSRQFLAILVAVLNNSRDPIPTGVAKKLLDAKTEKEFKAILREMLKDKGISLSSDCTNTNKKCT
jgi:hypothetical protein